MEELSSYEGDLNQQLSRRVFLKSGAGLLSAALLARYTGMASLLPLAGQLDPKRIYIAPDDHTDYFWTADEETYRQAFLEMIDYYLDLADSTADQPSDFQSRWNCDGSFWMWIYERNRPAADFERFISRVRSGHITVPLNALVICLGGVPAEAVLRGMYYAGQIERRYGLRFQLAIAMENQSLPYGLGSLWAGSGARYSWKGICNCDTRVASPGDREHEIYWMVGPDDSRILMKWNSLLGGPAVNDPNQSIGGYAEARDPTAVVNFVDSNSQFQARYPYRVIGAFGKGWDDLKTLSSEFVQVAKAASNGDRRVIVSNELDFFHDFEATYGASLPAVSCSFGNDWDLYCASLAEVSARVKRSVEKLRGAEALATLVSLKTPSFMDSRRTDAARAWMNLGLFWEHNFGMVNPQTGAQGVEKRIAWQRRLADEIASYVDSLAADAATALGSLIAYSGSAARFYAFNPLGWERSDVADLPYTGTEQVHVVDLSTGAEVPSQIVTVDGERRLRILAAKVPPVGYNVFELRSGAGALFAPAASVAGGSIDHAFYRLTVTPRGAITSLIDKQHANRECAADSNGRAINDLGPSAGTLQIESSGPVSVTMVATAAEPLQHTTRITLIRDSRRIEIHNQISQNFGDIVTWSFAFNSESPDVWHEEVGAVIRARLLSAGGHYSPRNARYDWLTLNHFAAVSGGGTTITLSNADCYFMRLGNSSPATLDTATAQIAVLAGGRVGGDGNSGLRDQGGDAHFHQRFALGIDGAFDPALTMRFALEHQNPLLTGMVAGGSAYPEASYSLLQIANPNVLLWALKPAEDAGSQHSVIMRVWNLAESPQRCAFSSPALTIAAAQQVSHIETATEDIAVPNGALTIDFAKQQIKTLALALTSVAQPPIGTATAQPTPTTDVAAPTPTATYGPAPEYDKHNYLPIVAAGDSTPAAQPVHRCSCSSGH